jgi:hypothetical protein
LFALVLCLLVLASGGQAQAAGVSRAQAHPSPALPPQGIYEGCAPAAGIACVERLARIRAAGFQLVLNYSAWYGSPAEVHAYADAAAALGLQLIWPLNHPAWRGLAGLGSTYSTFAGIGARAGARGSPAASPAPGHAGAPTPTDAELLGSAVAFAAAHPASWGFYIGDELPPAEAGRVRALSATVRALAPEEPQLYVARPGAGRLEPFARIADFAGADSYPIGSSDPPVRQAARSARAAAMAAGARTAMVLQAFAWSQYKPGLHPTHPTVDDLRAMRDAAIRHAGPAMILWYSYQDILRSDDPARRWRDLVEAAFRPH